MLKVIQIIKKSSKIIKKAKAQKLTNLKRAARTGRAKMVKNRQKIDPEHQKFEKIVKKSQKIAKNRDFFDPDDPFFDFQ